jgi:hypothetical protein
MFTIVFAVSFLVVILLLSLKTVENRRGESLAPLKTLRKLDEPLRNLLMKLGNNFNSVADTSEQFLVKDLQTYAKKSVLDAKSYLVGTYEKTLIDARGNRILKQTREVSGFLKDIAKHKVQNGKGRIDDYIN